MQNLTHRLHNITNYPFLHQLLYFHKGAKLGTRSVQGIAVKCEPGFSVALHHCETSVRGTAPGGKLVPPSAASFAAAVR